MSIKGRIERLEEKLGAEEGCPECGWRGSLAGAEVTIHEFGEYEGPEVCPECARQLRFILTIGSDLQGEEEEEGGPL